MWNWTDTVVTKAAPEPAKRSDAAKVSSSGAAYRWRMLALLCVSRVGIGFQFQTMGSVAAPVADELGLTYTDIGTLIGLFMLPGLVLAIPAGFASRHVPDRWLTGAGLALLGLGGLTAAVADGFGMLALGRLACGAGFVLSMLYFAKMVSDWFAGKELATAMSLLVMTWPLGIAMGQVGHEWLAAAFGWGGAFMAAATYCLTASAVVIMLYRAPVAVVRTPAAVAWRLPRHEWILTLLAALVWACFNAGYVVYLSFAPQVLIADGFTSLEAATTVSLGSWLMMGSGAACGYLADRTGRHDVILYVCMAVAISVVMLLPLTQYAVLLSLVFGLLGMAPAGVIMALTASAMAPERRAVGMGIFFTVYFAVSAPAPAIAGFLFDWSGDAHVAVWFGASLFVVTAAANFAFRLVHRGAAAA